MTASAQALRDSLRQPVLRVIRGSIMHIEGHAGFDPEQVPIRSVTLGLTNGMYRLLPRYGCLRLHIRYTRGHMAM